METAVEFTEAAVLVVGVDREGLMAAVSAASSIWQTLLCRQFFSLGGVGLDGLIDQQGRAACDLRCLHEAMPGHGVKRHRQLSPCRHRKLSHLRPWLGLCFRSGSASAAPACHRAHPRLRQARDQPRDQSRLMASGLASGLSNSRLSARRFPDASIQRRLLRPRRWHL